MTDIEEKALALVAQLQEEDDGRKYSYAYHFEALCRAIEQHEAFRQEVSDAVVAAKAYYEVPMYDLSAFILPKPDPLVEAMLRAWPQYADRMDACSNDAEALRAAIEKRGGKITWGEG